MYQTKYANLKSNVGIEESEMSAQELRLDDGYVSIKFIDDRLSIKLDVPCAVAVLDLNQAHLLYLFLKERFEETGRDDTFDNYPLEI